MGSAWAASGELELRWPWKPLPPNGGEFSLESCRAATRWVIYWQRWRRVLLNRHLVGEQCFGLAELRHCWPSTFAPKFRSRKLGSNIARPPRGQFSRL